nr:CD1871A family CXXC motif-containing protein [Anaerotruncus sp. DFI.9.16]
MSKAIKLCLECVGIG